MAITAESILKNFSTKKIKITDKENPNKTKETAIGNHIASNAVLKALVEAILEELKKNAEVSFNGNPVSGLTSPTGPVSGALAVKGGRIA